ncbi:hypothetical protein UFOVP447_135 [uncultured Caudovirales phage]|uniref:Uncharacterized protein n=1 Tax=uncultured Caudovirales phage TaxID=2100421 RepID=A0A6J5M9I0_9CAUD|nr:hypothetical protein UFOVP447_135 [uncultured Caudovirales phage]
MTKINLSDIATLTAEDAAILTGCSFEDFAKPGVYHVLVGSRGWIEFCDYLGDVNEIEIATKEELIASYNEVAFDDKDREDYAAMIEEFYGINVEDDHVNFAYTEEDYDVWLKIA